MGPAAGRLRTTPEQASPTATRSTRPSTAATCYSPLGAQMNHVFDRVVDRTRTRLNVPTPFGAKHRPAATAPPTCRFVWRPLAAARGAVALCEVVAGWIPFVWSDQIARASSVKAAVTRSVVGFSTPSS